MLYWVGPPGDREIWNMKPRVCLSNFIKEHTPGEEQKITVLRPGSLAHDSFPLMFTHLALLSFAVYQKHLYVAAQQYLDSSSTCLFPPYSPWNLRLSCKDPALRFQDHALIKAGKEKGTWEPVAGEDTELHKGEGSLLGDHVRDTRRTQVYHTSLVPLGFSIKLYDKWLEKIPTLIFIQEKTSYPVPTSAPLAVSLTLYTGWSEVDCPVLAAYRIADLAGIRLCVVLWHVDHFKHTAL